MFQYSSFIDDYQLLHFQACLDEFLFSAISNHIILFGKHLTIPITALLRYIFLLLLRLVSDRNIHAKECTQFKSLHALF